LTVASKSRSWRESLDRDPQGKKKGCFRVKGRTGPASKWGLGGGGHVGFRQARSSLEMARKEGQQRNSTLPNWRPITMGGNVDVVEPARAKEMGNRRSAKRRSGGIPEDGQSSDDTTRKGHGEE